MLRGTGGSSGIEPGRAGAAGLQAVGGSDARRRSAPPPRFIAHVNQPPREVYGCDAGAVGSFFCSTAAAGRTRPGPPAIGTGKSHFGKLCRKARRGGRPSVCL